MKISHRSIAVIRLSGHWRGNRISSYKCSEGRLKNKFGNFIEMIGAVGKPHHRCQFSRNKYAFAVKKCCKTEIPLV